MINNIEGFAKVNGNLVILFASIEEFGNVNHGRQEVREAQSFIPDLAVSVVEKSVSMKVRGNRITDNAFERR